MSTRVDVADIEITRGERLLGLVLAAFLLVGGLWGYFELNLADDEASRSSPVAMLSVAERATLKRRNAAKQRAEAAGERVGQLRRALVDRREAYRTALDEGRRDSRLARSYRLVQGDFDAERGRRQAAP